jgi:hypothetical protein
MKVKRKELLTIYFIIILYIMLKPFNWIYSKWEMFWNKEYEISGGK